MQRNMDSSQTGDASAVPQVQDSVLEPTAQEGGEMIQCACGCGTLLAGIGSRSRAVRFKRGHHLLQDSRVHMEQRFWSKVDKSGGPDACWPWTRKRTHDGYGVFALRNGKQHPAHRIAWELTNGEILHGLLACHHCDNRLCCNPVHLFLGTVRDNALDASRKGRLSCGDRHWSRLHPERLARGDRSGARLHPECRARGERHGSRLHPELCPRGERNGRAKLTEAQVIEIRSLGKDKSGIVLAQRFGVSKATIYEILKGTTWRLAP